MASKGVFISVLVLSLLLACSNARELSEETQNVDDAGEMQFADQFGPGPHPGGPGYPGPGYPGGSGRPGPGGFGPPCYQVCPYRRCCSPYSPSYGYYRRCCF